VKQSAKKKKRKKPDAKDSIFAVLVAGVLIAAALILYPVVINLRPVPTDETTLTEAPVLPTETTETPPAQPPVVSAPRTAPAQNPTVHPATVEPARAPAASPLPSNVPEPPAQNFFEQPVSRGTLVFVIDDAGNNLHDLEPFLKLDIPLTIAVLPGLPHSAEAARRIRAAGKEVFLHQPMEALGGQNPGPGAIMAGMCRDEIRAIIKENLDEIGPVVGMNNHAGSRVTMDEEAMETILALCREKGILFLDSRTTAESAAPRAAGRLGMNIGERDVFLDNIPERDSILRFINLGLQTAEQQGSAIMIGHVQSLALAPLLSELLPDLKERGFSFSPVSIIINRDGT
jgi:hypothetical protein